MQSTFTVLVTVEHDEGQGHSQSRVAELIQQALEEGTSDYAAFHSAQVDAFKGCVIVGAGQTLNSASDVSRLTRILPLHLAPA